MPAKWSDTAPNGLGKKWLALWRSCHRTLKDQETWADEQKPLLDEFVFAAKQAEEHRLEAEGAPFMEASSGRVYAHPGFALADQSAKRAAALAELLILTPKARRAHGLEGDENTGPEDALDSLDGGSNVTPIRRPA